MLSHWLVTIYAATLCRLRNRRVRQRVDAWSDNRDLSYPNTLVGFRNWEADRYGNHLEALDIDQAVLLQVSAALQKSYPRVAMTIKPTLSGYWTLRIEQDGIALLAIDWTTRRGFRIYHFDGAPGLPKDIWLRRSPGAAINKIVEILRNKELGEK